MMKLKTQARFGTPSAVNETLMDHDDTDERCGDKQRELSAPWSYEDPSPLSDPARRAERLVGLGFRCWVRGLQTSDTRFFDVCSRQYIQSFGLKDGLVLSTRLGFWVNALTDVRKRPFSIFEVGSHGFSHDEAVAISMIAASQHAECPALRACIFAITEAIDIDLAQLAAQDFADGLIDAGKILRPGAIAYPLQHMATGDAVNGGLAH